MVFEVRRNGNETSSTLLVKRDLSRLDRNNLGPGFFVTIEDGSGRKVLVKVIVEGQHVN